MSKFIGYEPCEKCRENGGDRRGDNKALYSDGGSHCFSCGTHTFPKHYKAVNEEIRTEDKAILPYDYTGEIPSNAWQWLLKYGLSWRYWQAHCGYSPAHQRLVIKVGEPTDFSIGRYIPPATGTGDVAVSKQPPKWFVYGNASRKSHLFGSTSSKEIVLVEDVISGHKLGYYERLALPLFGTNVHDCHLRTLRHIGLPIVMWLDKDQQIHARQRANRLSTFTGLPVRYVFTDADPKELSFKQIDEVLK